MTVLGLALLALSTARRSWSDDNEKPGGSGAGKPKVVLPRYLQRGKSAPISIQDAAIGVRRENDAFAWRVIRGEGCVLLSDPPAPRGSFKAAEEPPPPLWDLSALEAGEVTVVATEPSTDTGGAAGDVISDPGIITIVSISLAPLGTVTEGVESNYMMSVIPADLPLSYADWSLAATTGEVFAKGHLTAVDFILSADGTSRMATFAATLPAGTAGRTDISIRSTLAIDDGVTGLTFMETQSEPFTILPGAVELSFTLGVSPEVPAAGSLVTVLAEGTAPDPSRVSLSYRFHAADGTQLDSGTTTPIVVAGNSWSLTFSWTPPLTMAGESLIIMATVTDGVSSVGSTVTVRLLEPIPVTTLAFISVPATVQEGTRASGVCSITPDSVLPDIAWVAVKVRIPAVGYSASTQLDPALFRPDSGMLLGTYEIFVPTGTVPAVAEAFVDLQLRLSTGEVISAGEEPFTVVPLTPTVTPRIDIITPSPMVRREGLPMDAAFTLFPKSAADTLVALTVSIYDAKSGAQIIHSNLDTARWRPTDDHAMFDIEFTVPDGAAAMSEGTGEGVLVVEAFDATGRIAGSAASFTGRPRVTLTVTPSGDVLVEGQEEVLGLAIQPPVDSPAATFVLWNSSRTAIAKWSVPSADFIADFDPFGRPILVAVTRFTVPPGTVTADTTVVLEAIATERGGRVIESAVLWKYILRPASVSRVPELLSAAPSSALPLEEIVLAGRNFRSIPEENTVVFTRPESGAETSVVVELYPLSTTADGTSLVVSVPPRIGQGACEVRVRTADGESNAIPFTVLGSASAVGGMEEGIEAVLAIPGLKPPIKQALSEALKFVKRFALLESGAEAPAHGTRDLQKEAATLGQALRHLAMSIRALAGKPEAEALLGIGRQLVQLRALVIGSPILEEETTAILEFLARPGLQGRAATALLSALGAIDRAIDAYLLDWEVGVMDRILDMMYRLEDAERSGVATKATRKKTTRKLIWKWNEIRDGYARAGGAEVPMIEKLTATVGTATSIHAQCGSTKAVEEIRRFVGEFYDPHPPTVPISGPPGLPGMMKSRCVIFEGQVYPGSPIGEVEESVKVLLDPACHVQIAFQLDGVDRDDWVVGCVGCLPSPKEQPWWFLEPYLFAGCVQKKIVPISDYVSVEFGLSGQGTLRSIGPNSAIWDPGVIEKGAKKTATLGITIKDGRNQSSDWYLIGYALVARNDGAPGGDDWYMASATRIDFEEGTTVPGPELPGCGCDLRFGWEVQEPMNGTPKVDLPVSMGANTSTVLTAPSGSDEDTLVVICHGNNVCLPSTKRFPKEDSGLRWTWNAAPGTLLGSGRGRSVVFLADRAGPVTVSVSQDDSNAQGDDSPVSASSSGIVFGTVLREVSFGGATSDYRDVTRDDGSGAFTAPHWPGDTGFGEPVCYRSGSKMMVSAKFEASPAPIGTQVLIRGDGPDSLDFPVTAASQNGSELSIAGVQCESAFRADKIDIFHPDAGTDPLAIIWKVSTDGGHTWECVGRSENPVYVTLHAPLTTAWHTCLHIGCKNAKGMGGSSAAVARIWDEFTDRRVARVDGTVMIYWGPFSSGSGYPATSAGGASTTRLLLAQADGKCGDWSLFFVDCIKVQGVSGAMPGEISVSNVPQADGSLMRGRQLLIKKWDMSTVPPREMHGVEGDLPAQGENNVDPTSFFTNHCVVNFGGKLYDPSYGVGPFDALGEWESLACDGFQYWADTNGDGRETIREIFYIDNNDPGTDAEPGPAATTDTEIRYP
ncbi:MAG: hypothetical protein HYY93_05640 [Planctomycetes bacterium]|nr:hypothetical protein [Planctomycetota bacterium]